MSRIVGCSIMVCGLILSGCSQSNNSAKPKAKAETPNTIVGPTTPSATKTIPPAQDPRPAATPFATEFLSTLNGGSATSAQLTDAFKKIVAPPVLPGDKARGFSDLATDTWLKKFQGRVATQPVTLGAVTPEVVAVSVPAAGDGKGHAPGRTVLRLVKAGESWKVDWLHQAPSAGTPIPLDGEGDDLALRFAAAAFLETALTEGYDRTETLVLPEARAKLAPSLGGEDDARGYNRSILHQRFKAFRKSAIGYESAKHTITGSTAEVTGELLDGATAKRPFTLELVRGKAAGEWLVMDFQPR